ncbi:hypothetical protein [Streptomyces malaysiense]|uniref:Uncharacterized protein n=1 Tax=Streptomyces malaysiense TaxID=1428626 RepID=A0A1J4PS16_9ACTN|nr:hypothetical protein [Streptomyces malaysiense]OIK23116.1 hypothetical protein VT52_034290 [Streptomyces malaysiense]
MREEEARREFVSQVARRAVGAVAPEESVFFEPLAARFVSRGELPRERRYADGIISSGWDAAVALISPVALALAKALYDKLLENVSEEILKRSRRGLPQIWNRLRRADRTADGPPGDREAVAGSAEVRDQLVLRATELGLPEERARQLVDELLAAAEDMLAVPGTPAGDSTEAS